MKRNVKSIAAAVIAAIMCTALAGCNRNEDVSVNHTNQSLNESNIESHIESIFGGNTGTSSTSAPSKPEPKPLDPFENLEVVSEDIIAPPIDIMDWSAIPEASAEDFEIEESQNGLIRIKKYVGAGGDINIPSIINGKPVYEICRDSFSNCMSITSVNIPNSVGDIGSCAFLNCTNLVTVYLPNTEHTKTWNMGGSVFYGCTSLKNVYIPDCLSGLGDKSFSGCTSLECIYIPASVKSDRSLTFYNCTSLTSINVSPDNESFCSVNGVLFSKDKKTLICCPNAKKEYSIPDGVTTIGNGSFSGNIDLTSVNIPNSVVEIEGSAFSDCINLTSVTIPNGVTKINSSTFKNCTNLASVNIPNGVIQIDDVAFKGCTSLTRITLPDSLTKIHYSASESVFDGCEKIRIEYKGKTYEYSHIDDLVEDINNS